MEEFIDPKKIIDGLHLENDAIAADFGCGAGGFSIPLAQKLSRGIVYAIDVQASVLNSLKSLALTKKVNNIKFVRADLEKPRGSKMPDGSADLAVIANVLFQADDKNAIITEANRILKSGGKVLVIDWVSGAGQNMVKGATPIEEIKRIAIAIGLEPEKEFKAGNFHSGLLLVKK